MKKVPVVIFLLIGFCIHLAMAEEYAGEFLNIPVGAKAVGMGGAFGPCADDPSAIYWNPAGLGSLKKPELAIAHSSLFSYIANHDFLSLVWPLSRNSSIGLAWIRFGVDDIPRFSFNVGTLPEGTFGDNENAVLLSYGNSINRVSFGKPWIINTGGSIKYIYNSLDDRTATGVGLDLGLLIKIDIDDWMAQRSTSQPIVGILPAMVNKKRLGGIALSLVGDDIGGTKIAWNTRTNHSDVRITKLKYGLSYNNQINLIKSEITIAWENSSEEYYRERLGAEIKYRKMIAFRTGWAQKRANFGAGLYIWRFNIDYAYSAHDLGSTHRIGGCFELK
jgi:hypothetical protein